MINIFTLFIGLAMLIWVGYIYIPMFNKNFIKKQRNTEPMFARNESKFVKQIVIGVFILATYLMFYVVFLGMDFVVRSLIYLMNVSVALHMDILNLIGYIFIVIIPAMIVVTSFCYYKVGIRKYEPYFKSASTWIMIILGFAFLTCSYLQLDLIKVFEDKSSWSVGLAILLFRGLIEYDLLDKPKTKNNQ
jgi:hypothetical protein